ncbi:MAG: DUF1801 domain-containing protein [Candidatus Saccharimonadales bacterium]
MNKDIAAYNHAQEANSKVTCDLLCQEISKGLPKAESKVWHGHPVWFIEGNPVAGYAVQKDNVQLLFWSGQSFGEPGLKPEGSFKAAEVRISNSTDVNTEDLARWLKKAETIQWDYKSIVKRRGILERLK